VTARMAVEQYGANQLWAHGGDGAHGGGGVGEAEAVLQPHRQLVRGEPQVRRVHAGGVEEVDGARVRSSDVRESDCETCDHLYQICDSKTCKSKNQICKHCRDPCRFTNHH